MDNIKVKINEKERSVRFNPKKVCFECNVGYKDNQFKQQSRIIRGASIDELSEIVVARDPENKDYALWTWVANEKESLPYLQRAFYEYLRDKGKI